MSTHRHRSFLSGHSCRDRTSYNYLDTGVRKWPSGDIKKMRAPACSVTALRKMGFVQSLHCTIPTSEVLLRGSAPKIFMSRAASHEVGGGKADKEGGEGGGGLDRVWNERGAGDGVGECLSLRRTAMMEKPDKVDQIT